jgi:putative Mg2+ transporter-C (MgtC) family protein
LGAGSIIQSRGSVQGITTAATIWVVGALGVCAGLGAYSIALTVVVVAFVILRFLGMMENRWLKEHQDGQKITEQERKAEDKSL